MNGKDEQLQHAITQAKAGNKAEAKRILAQVVNEEPRNGRAWYLLSQVVDSPEQAVFCLNKALEIEPGNVRVQERLQALRGKKVEGAGAQAHPGQVLPAAKPVKKAPWVKWVVAVVGSFFVVCCILTMAALIDSSNDEAAQAPTLASTETPVEVGQRFAEVATEEPTAIPPTETPLPMLSPIPPGAEVSDGRPACIPANAPLEVGLVTSVVDGDTIHVLIDGQDHSLRYIGIDTPETVHPEIPVEYFGPEASAKNKELVEGKSVILVKDVSDTDQYGRLLRYVFVEDLAGLFVNFELVRAGYAHASTYPPDVACADFFSQAEQAARVALAGLWGPVAIPSLTPVTGGGGSERSSVVIADIFYDGNEPRFEGDEYAVITNQGTAAVNMKGWRLNAGDPGQDFNFPDFVLGAGESCRVYTNQVNGDSCGGRGFGSGQAVWNNKGDCGYLFDAGGTEVDRKCY